MSQTRFDCQYCHDSINNPKNFCYRCGAFADPETHRILEYGEVSPSQLEELVREHDAAWTAYGKDEQVKIWKKKLTIGCTILLIGLALSIIGIGVPIVIGAVVYLALACIRHGKGDPMEDISISCYNGALGRYVVPGLLPKIMDQVERHDYAADIFRETFRESQLILEDYTHSSWKHYTKGIYHSIPVEFCFSDITEDRTKPGEDIHTARRIVQVFRGMWFICHMGFSLPAEVRIWKRGKQKRKGILKTGDQEFDENFYVESADEALALRILTPEMKQALLSLGDIRLYLKTNGDVVIALNDNSVLLPNNDIHQPIAQTSREVTDLLRKELGVLDVLPLNQIR